MVRNVSLACDFDGQEMDVRLNKGKWLHEGKLYFTSDSIRYKSFLKLFLGAKLICLMDVVCRMSIHFQEPSCAQSARITVGLKIAIRRKILRPRTWPI